MKAGGLSVLRVGNALVMSRARYTSCHCHVQFSVSSISRYTHRVDDGLMLCKF